MKSLTISLLSVVALAFASNAHASGFLCSEDFVQGYNVKLFNKTTGGTRVPAKLVVSHADASPATLLVAGADEITKRNRANTVQYITEGNSKIGAEKVILQISFKEGAEVLEEGEEVPGQLILIDEEGSREVVRLTCERYLKN